MFSSSWSPLKSLLTDFCQQLYRLIHLCPCSRQIKPPTNQHSKMLHSADTRTAHATKYSTAKCKGKEVADSSTFLLCPFILQGTPKITPSPECFLYHFIFRLQLRLFWSKSITEKWALPFTFAKGWEINLRSIKAEVSVGINFHLAEFIHSHRIPQFLAVSVA